MNAVVFHAYVSGGVNGEFIIEVPEEVKEATDRKVRLRSDLNDCLFHVAGKVSADLGSGENVLFGPASDTWWDITGSNEVTVGDNGSFRRAFHLHAGPDGDHFACVSDGEISGDLIAISGNDTLSYSVIASPVTVDLAGKPHRASVGRSSMWRT